MSLAFLPFSYHWMLARAIGEVITVLDLGCGDGSLMEDIYKDVWQITGVELHNESIENAKKLNIYKKIYKADVTRLPSVVASKKYDVVFSSQVLEHLDKKEALVAIRRWEKLATKRVVISTTVGFIDYDPIEKQKDENPLQKHKSGWDIEDFTNRGYKVYGQGPRIMYGPEGLARKYPKLMGYFSVVSFLLSPVTYLIPSVATYMIACKNIAKQ